MDFNGGADVTVAWLAPVAEGGFGLEDNEELMPTIPFPAPSMENEQWEDCYDEAQDSDNDTPIVRFIQFTLQDLDEELGEGELLQLPFNNAADGGYLLSMLKFGYLGLHDEDFQPMSMQETTEVKIEIIEVEVYNDTAQDFYDYRTGVLLTYVDDYGEEITARIDEGPFRNGDILLIGDVPVELGDFEYDNTQDSWSVEYKLKDGSEWDDDWTVAYGNRSSSEFIVDSQLMDTNVTVEYENISVSAGIDGYLDNTTGEENEAQVYLNAETDTSATFNLTGYVSTSTEFDNDVYIEAGPSGYDDFITIDGNQDSGAEDDVIIQIDDTEGETEAEVLVTEGYPTLCTLSGDCAEYSTGEKDGILLSMSGGIVEIDGDEDAEEPNDAWPDGTDEDETIESVTLTIPENEMRPTVFLGYANDENSSEITITDANVGTEVTIGGIPVMVDEFGVTGSVAPGTVVGGEPVTVECDPVEVTCDPVTVETMMPNDIGYKLVVVEGSESKSNLVLIGGPSVNSMTKDLTTVDELCSAAVVKMVGNKLLVAGCEAADTAAAANDLVNWLKANV
jgi:hypothetical protein